MKKITFAISSIALLSAACVIAPIHVMAANTSSKKATAVTTASVPPPLCSPNDPNGCGIYQ